MYRMLRMKRPTRIVPDTIQDFDWVPFLLQNFDPEEPRDDKGKWVGIGIPDPSDSDLSVSARKWIKGSSKIQKDITKLIRDPEAKVKGEDARNILGAIHHRGESAPELHRGMWWAAGDEHSAEAFTGKLTKGSHIDFPVSSFSSDRGQAERFASPADGNLISASVMITVQPGSNALDISNIISQESQKELISGGRYEIVSVGTNPVSQALIDQYKEMGFDAELKRLQDNVSSNIAVVLRQVNSL